MVNAALNQSPNPNASNPNASMPNASMPNKLLKKRIGLLGGSFNPAHEGHVYISKKALKILALDEVWWLVSPQNPLKSSDQMASFEDRWQMAKKMIAKEPKLKLSDFERMIGESRTLKTMQALKRVYGHNLEFIFLIGSDNVLQMPNWFGWQRLISLVPIAVFPRNPHNLKARFGKIACRIHKKCYSIAELSKLVHRKPPALGFLSMRMHPLSATMIRNQANKLRLK